MADGARHRIMVVDDEQDIRTLLTMYLGETYEVFTATNGLDAMLKLPKYQPDLAILDIMMPIMDGHELARKIRGERGYADIPIIVVSALNQKADIKKGYDAGANLYLTKPFQPERVQRMVRMSIEDLPIRPKDLSIEEILEREKAHEEQLKRALEKKSERTSTTTVRKLESDRPPDAVRRPPTTQEEEPPQSQSASRETRKLTPEELREMRSTTRMRRSAAQPPRIMDETPKDVPEKKPAATKEPEKPKEKLPASPVPGATPRILIVDDDEDFVMITRTQLEEDYEVVTSHDGFDAINKIKDVEPDLFIIDGMMPRMSGYQLVDMLKGAIETYKKPIIFVSAKGSDRDQKMLLNKGVDHYLVKPFSADALADAIREVVNQPNFTIAPKSRSIRDVLYDEGVRRAAQISTEARKKRWETYGTLEKFLREEARDTGKEK